MAYKDNDKKSNNLSYSDWFSFYLSIFTNNIALAQLCAKKAYLNQIYNQEIEDDTEEIDNLLAEINVGLEELKKDGHKHFYWNSLFYSYCWKIYCWYGYSRRKIQNSCQEKFWKYL